MPLSKDIMNFRWNMKKIAKNDGHATNLKNLLLDDQKGTRELVPYASLGTHVPNDYF